MNLFVTKLDYGVRNSDLNDLFSDFGEVESAFVVMDKALGRSKGFGFVDMPNDDEAQKAIDTLNGSVFAGREIIVKKAEPRKVKI